MPEGVDVLRVEFGCEHHRGTMGSNDWWSSKRFTRYSRDGIRLENTQPRSLPTEAELAYADRVAAEILKSTPDWAWGQIYARLGEIPADERSVNHLTGEPEAGVSVLDADWHPVNGLQIWCGHKYPGYDRVLVVRGNEVGNGSDGEPLLRDIEVLEVYLLG